MCWVSATYHQDDSYQRMEWSSSQGWFDPWGLECPSGWVASVASGEWDQQLSGAGWAATGDACMGGDAAMAGWVASNSAASSGSASGACSSGSASRTGWALPKPALPPRPPRPVKLKACPFPGCANPASWECGYCGIAGHCQKVGCGRHDANSNWNKWKRDPGVTRKDVGNRTSGGSWERQQRKRFQ